MMRMMPSKGTKRKKDKMLCLFWEQQRISMKEKSWNLKTGLMTFSIEQGLHGKENSQLENKLIYRPCLSLDILVPRHKKDTLTTPSKVELKKYPLSVYVVAGSQATNKNDNAVYIMKWSRLHKTKYDDDSDIIDEEDLDYDEEPRLDVLSLSHPDPINRLRSMNNTGIVALWDESGRVSIYDTTRHIQKLVEYNEGEEEIVDDEGPNPTPQGLQPPQDPTKRNFLVSSFQHSSEGFALQWSQTTLGIVFFDMKLDNYYKKVYWRLEDKIKGFTYIDRLMRMGQAGAWTQSLIQYIVGL